MGRHKLPKGATALKRDWTPSQRTIRMALIRLRQSWSPSDRENRLEEQGEVKLSFSLLNASQARIIAGCEALKQIGTILAEARDSLAWLNGHTSDQGLTFENCMEAAERDPDIARAALLSQIEQDYKLGFDCLTKAPLYFCPVCGPVKRDEVT